jgi:putative nucleotidyltransferase with HDIG domain
LLFACRFSKLRHKNVERLQRRILFVDDEANVLLSIRRMLHAMRDEWQMQFAESGVEALDLLEKEPVDVIVTDMRMPQMDGAQLLMEVKKRFPQIVRIVLSGHSDQELILKSVRPAHQYLSKPADAETLKSTVSRACALRDLLRQDGLKGIISQLDSLPSLPSLYTEIMEELQTKDCSFQKIAQIIAKDLGMTAKILQLVNSAFFGLPRHISDPQQAVSLLGLDTVKALVLTVEVFSKFDRTNLAFFDIERLWEHSIITGQLVKQISIAEQAEKQLVDDAFLGGLLHDIGKLVLAANFPDKYREVFELTAAESLVLNIAESHLLGAGHAEVGAYLLGLWGLPDAVIEAVAFHHRPWDCLANTLIPPAAVHIADALQREGNNGNQPNRSEPSSLDPGYLKKIGLEERIPIWRKIHADIVQEGKSHE